MIKKAINFLGKLFSKPFILLIGLLLVIPVLICIIFYQPDVNIVGTFTTSNDPGLNGEYLTFMKDGLYYYYRQFQMLDSGSYSLNSDGICTLASHSNTSAQQEILYIQDKIYNMGSNDTFQIFERLSKTPLFINITAENLPPADNPAAPAS